MAEHRQVTDTNKEEAKHSEQQRPMGEPYTLDKIEQEFPDGHLDADDFYFSKDEKTFFDPWGYRFDQAEDG